VLPYEAILVKANNAHTTSRESQN